MKVYAVVMDFGLNGSEVHSTWLNRKEAETMAKQVGDTTVPGADYKYSSCTGWGGAEVTEVELS